MDGFFPTPGVHCLSYKSVYEWTKESSQFLKVNSCDEDGNDDDVMFSVVWVILLLTYCLGSSLFTVDVPVK